jgi:hypothetical protein
MRHSTPVLTANIYQIAGVNDLRQAVSNRHEAAAFGSSCRSLAPSGASPYANQEETLATREKQKLIKERLHSWLVADPDRTERLVRISSLGAREYSC